MRIKVERRAPYQGVPQWGITGAAEITPSRKTAEKWAQLENARLAKKEAGLALINARRTKPTGIRGQLA